VEAGKTRQRLRGEDVFASARLLRGNPRAVREATHSKVIAHTVVALDKSSSAFAKDAFSRSDRFAFLV
jgi:hypothetical protein